MWIPVPIVLGIQILAAASMLGVIWVIQWVHYPSMAYVDPGRFEDAHRQHTARITHIVLPAMGLELVAALAAPLLEPALWRSPLYLVAGLALAAAWISTAVVQVPLHARLAEGFSPEHVARLVWTNWIRTAAWSLRVPTLCLLVARGHVA